MFVQKIISINILVTVRILITLHVIIIIITIAIIVKYDLLQVYCVAYNETYRTKFFRKEGKGFK